MRAKLKPRQTLARRASRANRNIGVSDRRRRDATTQSMFGALVQVNGVSLRDMEEKYHISKSLLYRYVRFKWSRPTQRIRDNFLYWFQKETRRILDVVDLELMVKTEAPQDPVKMRDAVRAFLAKLPVVVQDAEKVGEVTL